MKRSQERQALILSMLQSKGFVPIELMASTCGTSLQTIRRDLSELSRTGKVLRYHGGARLSEPKRAENYRSRSASHVEEKRVAAELLVDQIQDGSSLFLAGGSTLTLVAEALLRRDRLTIVTNNLHAALTLYDKEGFNVHVVGGWIRTASGSLVGANAASEIGTFSLDAAIISTSAITEEGALLEYDESLVGPINAMIANARRTILVADCSKFGRTGIVRAAHLRDVDLLVTDRVVPSEFAELLQHYQIDLING
ncbi:DeoR/GlpR family DNA-binding transcription regulator [Microvirga sp. M2]|uniref:DeoR/GlpR family DNA-binding transcription regulator n=1 Tax=Microvirga sp. M2 TaxID=3073270 RepID=UPI0039C114D0